MTTLRPDTRPVAESAAVAPPPKRIEVSIGSIALRGLPDPGPSGRHLLAQAAQAELVRLIANEHPHRQPAERTTDSVRGGSIFVAGDPRRLGESIARAVHRELGRG